MILRISLFFAVVSLIFSETAAQSLSPETYRAISADFSENRGQWNEIARFLAKFPSANIWVDSVGSLTVDMYANVNTQNLQKNLLQKQSPDKMPASEITKGEAFRLKLGGKSAKGIMPSKNVVNYLKGSSPERWTVKAKQYRGIEISLGNGIIRIINNSSSVREPILLQATFPSLSAAQEFVVQNEGKRFAVNDNGAMLETIAGKMIFGEPNAVQLMKDSSAKQIKCACKVMDSALSFSFEQLENDRPIVLTVPMLFSIVEGGSSAEFCSSVAIDTNRNAYITGGTLSADFPTTTGAYNRTLRGKDCFVTKFASNGSSAIYTTFLGGSSDDESYGIVADAAGSAYITGVTTSNDFPATPGSFQTKRRDNPSSFNSDCFVSKLTPDGSGLVYSTYFGGKQIDVAKSIAVDFSGNAFIGGYTGYAASGAQDSFPITPKTFSRTHNGGVYDGFVAKFSSDGSKLIYCSYIGGNDGDYVNALSVGLDGALYITGETLSKNFPRTPSVGQRVTGLYECFISKISKDADSLLYSVVIGGEGWDSGKGIATDIFGNAFVTGYTFSKEFPVTQGALDTALNGSAKNASDAFILKLSPKADYLIYSTFLGGSGNDEASGIAIDVCGAAYISGSTESLDFPVTSDAFDAKLNNGVTGQKDAFTAKINSDGNTLVYSTFIGGSSNDEGSCIAVDATGAVYVGGTTSSGDFPITTQMGNLNKENVSLMKLQVGILPLSPDITAAGPVKFCDGGAVTLSTASNYRIYQWLLDGMDIAGATAPQIEATKNGRYTVVVTDASGCTGSKDMVVTVYPRPRIFAGRDTVACPDSAIQLHALTPDSVRLYRWQPSAGLDRADIPSPIARLAATTNYILTVTDTNNCVSSDTVRIVVISPDDIVAHKFSDTLFACPGDSLPIDLAVFNSSEADLKVDISSANSLFRLQNSNALVPSRDTIIVPLVFGGSMQNGTISTHITIADMCGNKVAADIAVFVGAPKVKPSIVADTTVCLHEMALRQVWVRNSSRSPANLRIVGGNDKFTAIAQQLYIAGKDSAVFTIQFAGDTVAGTYRSVFYLDDQCGGRDSVELNVVVKGVPLIIRASGADPDEAAPGVQRIVPIIASDLAPINESPNKKLEFTLLYDRTVLSLDSIVSAQCNATVIRTELGKAIVRFDNCADSVKNPLAKALFSAVVGETLTPLVQITDVKAGDKCIAPGASLADTVKMLPYGCEIRTLNVQFFASALRSTYPSPTDDILTVEYSSVEETNVRISLVSALGQIVGKIINASHKPGVYSAHFITADMPSGSYMLIMDAGQYRATTPVLIAH